MKDEEVGSVWTFVGMCILDGWSRACCREIWQLLVVTLALMVSGLVNVWMPPVYVVSHRSSRVNRVTPILLMRQKVPVLLHSVMRTIVNRRVVVRGIL